MAGIVKEMRREGVHCQEVGATLLLLPLLHYQCSSPLLGAVEWKASKHSTEYPSQHSTTHCSCGDP